MGVHTLWHSIQEDTGDDVAAFDRRRCAGIRAVSW
eukprot:CAMPEP_0201683958 /NCGR_PEP_ID=MMETSP0494-20130426/52392_1 /ASSEMBLY_ACC=CAM_ASM_000839 /TAXON_ID=420259 /ORGANISM="Thalassiosira gravida, Strain GMp14c1" /LENGTH=34 /DNA_ID= /DNA_START= /DNA_END= /DNA_ORIENTATION=